jgi:hypothetical protein
MARTTLAERQVRLEQQRARLQMEENSLREAERKARTRRLIEAGGLVDKAGLLNVDSAVLYGALMQVAADARSTERVEQWRVAGGRAFDRETKARDAGREPLVLTRPPPRSRPSCARQGFAGRRCCSIGRAWPSTMKPPPSPPNTAGPFDESARPTRRLRPKRPPRPSSRR